jgi:hypothetical protein
MYSHVTRSRCALLLPAQARRQRAETPGSRQDRPFALEPLKERRLLSTFIVTDAADAAESASERNLAGSANKLAPTGLPTARATATTARIQASLRGVHSPVHMAAPHPICSHRRRC